MVPDDLHVVCVSSCGEAIIIQHICSGGSGPSCGKPNWQASVRWCADAPTHTSWAVMLRCPAGGVVQVEEKTAAREAAAAVVDEAKAAEEAQANANQAGLQRATETGKALDEAINNLQVNIVKSCILPVVVTVSHESGVMLGIQELPFLSRQVINPRRLSLWDCGILERSRL